MSALKTIQVKLGLEPNGVIDHLTFGAIATSYGFTPIQTAHFLGQLHHESAGFTRTEEDLARYTAANLLAVFPKYYTPDLAKKHAHKPSVISNHVYGGRLGNTEINDGWHFRGRGFVQLTGRANYEAFAEWIGTPAVLTDPDLVAGKYALACAVWYFYENKIFELCKDLSEETILAVSCAVNLGNAKSTKTPNGLEDRIKQTIFYSRFVT